MTHRGPTIIAALRGSFPSLRMRTDDMGRSHEIPAPSKAIKNKSQLSAEYCRMKENSSDKRHDTIIKTEKVKNKLKSDKLNSVNATACLY